MGNQQPRLCVSYVRRYIILIENQIIQLRVNKTSLQHFIDKGYSVKVNQTIGVNAEDLTRTCKKKVEVVCDYCGQVVEKSYDKYLKGREIVQKDACFDCFSIKQKEVTQYKYGVDCTLQLESVKKKSIKTLQNTYGVDNIMQSELGKDNFKNTMLERYGVEYAQQSEQIQQTTKMNNIKKFGVEHPMYLSDVRKKVANTLFVNGVRVSKGQKKLAEHLDGSINTNINGFFADIVLINEKVIVEYDGSGHNLSVQLNKISQEEFDNKENDRIKSLTDSGWKCLIVKDIKDKHFDKITIKNIKQNIADLKSSGIKVKEYIIS